MKKRFALVFILFIFILPICIADTPIFTFVQVSDTHVGSFGSYQAGMSRFINRLKGGAEFSNPDFVILTGDLAADGTQEEFDEFKQLMDSSGITYYPIPGNHDGGYRQIPEWFVHNYGEDHLNFDFVHKGIHFILLSRYATGTKSGMVEGIVSKSNIPVIVADHYPIYAPRKDGRAVDYKMGSSALVDVFKKYPGKVVAFLSGHSHVNSLIVRTGVYHVNTQAIATTPNPVKHFSVYSDRIEVKTYSLDVSGWGGYQWHDTDEDHSTIRLYNWGNDDERNFVIPLGDPIQLESCSVQGGDVCENSESCTGSWLPASDSSRCCAVQCTVPSQPETCSDKNGDVCSDAELCEGNWISSSDSARCCDVTCKVPNQPITCSDKNGDICSANELCEGSWLNVSDSSRCCDQQCKASDQPKTCSQLNRDVCTTDERCPGNWIAATDTTRCCDVSCEPPLDPSDLNKDNNVDIADLILLIRAFGTSQHDMTADGVVDVQDLLLIIKKL